MKRKGHLRIVPAPEPSGLDNLAYAIRLEAYYRLNARAVWLSRPPHPHIVHEHPFFHRVERLFRRLCFWKRAPREGFFNFEEALAW